MAGKTLSLDHFVPNGKVSTGLMTKWNDKWVFALTESKYWYYKDGCLHVSLVCLGGKQEAGETLPQALAREVREEAHCDTRIISSPETLFVWANDQQERRTLDLDEPAPFLVWNTTIVLKDKNAQPYTVPYITAVYRGQLLSQPQPGAEIPGLAFLSAEEIAAIDQSMKLSLADIELIMQPDYTLDQPVRFILMGSALYVARLGLMEALELF